MDINKIYEGDSLEVLKTFPDESVDCVITSPPYWGLRDYGTAKWEGGDGDCDHKEAKLKSSHIYSLASSPIQDGERTGTDAPKWKDVCPNCGAIKKDGQIGLEKTPEEYVKKMVELFREVKRILKKEGTLWLNLGDSYSGSGRHAGSLSGIQKGNKGSQNFENGENPLSGNVPEGLKPKDLCPNP